MLSFLAHRFWAVSVKLVRHQHCNKGSVSDLGPLASGRSDGFRTPQLGKESTHKYAGMKYGTVFLNLYLWLCLYSDSVVGFQSQLHVCTSYPKKNVLQTGYQNSALLLALSQCLIQSECALYPILLQLLISCVCLAPRVLYVRPRFATISDLLRLWLSLQYAGPLCNALLHRRRVRSPDGTLRTWNADLSWPNPLRNPSASREPRGRAIRKRRNKYSTAFGGLLRPETDHAPSWR